MTGEVTRKRRNLLAKKERMESEMKTRFLAEESGEISRAEDKGREGFIILEIC